MDTHKIEEVTVQNDLRKRSSIGQKHCYQSNVQLWTDNRHQIFSAQRNIK